MIHGMNDNYQVIARKYRPQRFSDVIGQEPIVTTLVNAIKFNRLASAYLFCGCRGTGKTSIARIFAKALNCQNPGPDFEPCNQCSSCKEITASNSLDVLEIDGASNRGIDDIRTINETVGYSPTNGKYKIYLIDEVHMLTKEAFNALLKTLEEPPPTVKFLFATTEPHKIPQTILSRCQRFQLHRIPNDRIISKLHRISKEMALEVEEEALQIVAKTSEGSLRDAESLFDQIISFQGKNIKASAVTDILGLVPKKAFFALDEAGKAKNLGFAFVLANQVFMEGKDLHHFVDSLIEHFRSIMIAKLNPKESHEDYVRASNYYSQEQCLHLLDYLIESKQQMKGTASPQLAVEAMLLHILQSHHRITLESLIQRLFDLEQKLGAPEPKPMPTPPATPPIPVPPAPLPPVPPAPTPQEPAKVTPPKAQLNIPKGKDETLMRFAAVELEGTLKTNIR